MITQLKSVVPERVKGMPAAQYIERAWPLIGKKRISDALKAKQLRVNGVKSDENTVINGGDEICVYIDGKLNTELETVFEDGNLIAFVKPEGLPVDADESGIGEDTVLSRLKSRYPEAELVHRLDTGTSGVMIAALNRASRDKLEEMFKEHCFRKTYRADVFGRMPKQTDTLDAYLVKDASASKVKVIQRKTDSAKDIRTIYRLIDEKKTRGQTVSRLYVEIPTGRTHQIRAHMAFIGHPLLGDDKYGDRNANKALKLRGIRLRCVELAVYSSRIAPEYHGMKFTVGEDEKWTYQE